MTTAAMRSSGGDRMRVAVVGAGIGGLTTAAALAHSDADVVLFDQATRLREAGFGLQLTPNATRLLARLGVSWHLGSGPPVVPLVREVRRWDDGQLLATTALGPDCVLKYGAPYLTVLRSDLQAALLQLVAPGTVCLGHRLTGLTETESGVRLGFAGRAGVDVDLVVGADGARSTVRGWLAADRLVGSGLAAYRALAPAEDLPPSASEPRVQIWIGATQHCVVYPVAGRRWVNVVAMVPATGREDAGSWSAADRVADLTAAYTGWDPALRTILDAVNPVGPWSLHDRGPLSRWVTDRVTVVGDAAHPMLPFLAQGANQAIEDAATLATVLSGAGSGQVAPHLRRYQAMRADRAGAVLQWSRRVAAGTGPPDLGWLYGYDVASATPVAPLRMS